MSGARDQNLRDLLESGNLPDSTNDILGVGIQSWIVPLVMLRVVNTVVWVHSDWCEQLPDGTYHLSMGFVGDVIKISTGKAMNSNGIEKQCAESYFGGGNAWINNIPVCFDWTLVVKTLPRDGNASFAEKVACDVHKELCKNSVAPPDGESRACYYMRVPNPEEPSKYDTVVPVPNFDATKPDKVRDGRPTDVDVQQTHLAPIRSKIECNL